MTTPEEPKAGWLEADENKGLIGAKDYSLDKSISKITPESVEDEAKNIKLVRAVLFKYGEAGNDIAVTLKRRLQIVEDEKKSDDTLFNKLLQIVEDEKKSDDTLFNKLSKLVEDGKKSDDTLFNELSKLVEDEKKSNDTLFNKLLSLVEGEKKSGTKKTLFKRLSKLVEAENKSDTILLKRLLDLVKYQKESITTPYFFIPLTKDAEINPDQTLGLPSKIDLSKWFCKVQSQGVIPSCTAHAGISLMEYFQNRISGDTDWSNQESYLSWRFLYRVTRNLEGINQKGDESKKLPEKLSDTKGADDESKKLPEKLSDTKGATIRQTLKAMVLFGVPPENSRYWTLGKVTSDPSTAPTINPPIDYIDDEPSSFLYAYAQNYQATNYFRLDKLKDEEKQLKANNQLEFKFPEKIQQKGSNEKQQDVTINELILIQVRISIASGFPCIFGIKDTKIFGDDEVKKVNEKNLGTVQLEGGHALVAVGYDDEKLAFKVRNSWGDTWGDNGYVWLPYKYLLTDEAINWWSMLDAEWIDFGKFGLDIKNGELEPLMGSQGFFGGRWWTSLSPFK